MSLATGGVAPWTDDLCEEDEIPKGVYWDEINDKELDPILARRARKEEIDVFRERQVYDLIPRAQVPAGKKIIGTRW